MARSTESFYSVVSEAIKDFTRHGYDNETRLEIWLQRIKRAAALSLISSVVMENELRRTLNTVYTRLVEKRGALKVHSGIDRFTLDRIKPKLRAELDRRIAASANLIKLHRQEAIETTLRRFSGWSTSIPAGGSENVSVRAEGENIRKALSQLDFVQRRVVIDQGHKLTSSINQTIAQDGGAIAVIWRSHWRQPGYHYRPDHKERDKKCYLLENTWATEKGYVKPSSAGYYNSITAFGEEVYCRCYGVYIYALRDLPEEMLTAKGKTALAEVRKKIASSK